MGLASVAPARTEPELKYDPGRVMTQSKALLIAAISFVVTAGFMVMLCANAHIDIFPCKRTMKDFTTGTLKTTESTCSLMGHLNESGIPGEKDELTGAGWAMLVAFCFGIAAADSALLYTVLSRKANKTA
jgi:hypothetical protein